MRIGEFEVAARAADPERELDTFLFCGQEFTVAPEVNILAIGRFQMAAGEGVDSNDPDALPLLIQTIASCVVEEDENRFLNLATRRRADPDLLLKMVQAVIESQTGFPTEPPADSSPGLSTTGASSKVLSSSVAPSAPRTWRDTPFGRRELAAHPELYEDMGTVADQGRALSAAG
jgi:hypothetical protein